MDDVTLARWQQIVDRFELTKDGAKPWDAKTLDANFSGASHGEKCTICFLLNVWAPGGTWQCGSFDFIDAFRVWHPNKRDAFLAWAKDPMWP